MVMSQSSIARGILRNHLRRMIRQSCFFETRGVLLHELTHAYQLEPQGIGSYGTNRVFLGILLKAWADAVRVANGGFDGPNARPKGGKLYGRFYRTAGYFFVWLRDNKDPEFLRKFNRSTLEVVPWSFDGAIKHILGNEYNIDELWHEYQVAVGRCTSTIRINMVSRLG